MTKQEIDGDLPIIEVYYEETIRTLETRTTRSVRKVSKRTLLDTYFATRDIRATARACHCSPSYAQQMLARAVYIARRAAGLWSPPDLR